MTSINVETVPTFYQGYVHLVKHLDMMAALHQSRQEMDDLILNVGNEKENFSYAPGKWSVKELLLHVADAERIFAYRALTFARNDKTPLPGFDENAYVPESNAKHRSLMSIREELNNVRASTIDLFANFSETVLERKGFANKTEISVLTLGYVISGHEIHHLNVLNERYLVQ